MLKKEEKIVKIQSRYGIGEWYGLDFASLSPEEIRTLANPRQNAHECRFRGGKCHKKGGVCSLRLYQKTAGGIAPVSDPITTCPQRFKEANRALKWIAQTLIGTDDPEIIREVPFLISNTPEPETADANTPLKISWTF